MRTMVLLMAVLFGYHATAEDRVQFMGLITFVQQNGKVEAILPRVNGDKKLHIKPHTAMILFPTESADADDWPVGPAIEGWSYVELHSETVTFNREPLTGNARPTFLPKLNDGCCGWIWSLDNDYKEHENPVAAAHVVIPHSELRWGQDPPNKEKHRVDTMAVLAPGAEPLVITAKIGFRTRTLTFQPNAKVVIANFSLDEITHPTPLPATVRTDTDEHPHFMFYYKMVNLGGLCSVARVPSVKDECRRDPASDHLKVPLLLTIGAGFRGTDINCSNSTYP